VTLGLAAMYAGVWMMRNSGRQPVTAGGYGLLGGMLSIGGGLLIVLVFMTTVGPWRAAPPATFPVHIMDLHQPISQAERNAGPAPVR
jgi:hypothetical protein